MTLAEALVLLRLAKRQLREYKRELKAQGYVKRSHPIYNDPCVFTRDGKTFGLMYFEGAYSSYHEYEVWTPEAWQAAYDRGVSDQSAFLDYAKRHDLLGVL